MTRAERRRSSRHAVPNVLAELADHVRLVVVVAAAIMVTLAMVTNAMGAEPRCDVTPAELETHCLIVNY